MSGVVTPDAVNSEPAIETPVRITGAVPEDVRVRDCDAVCPTFTLPKFILFVLMLRVGTAALSCRAKLFETPPAVAVSAAVCTVLTEFTVAENEALVALAGTVTVAGKITAPLLLVSPMLIPPLGAALFSVTVHASEPAPVIDALPHARALKTGALAMPVPLSATTAEPLFDELLTMVNWPVAAPANVGSNWISSVAVWPEFRVIGKVAPESVKPAPVTPALSMMIGAEPVAVTVTDSVVGAFTATLPNEILPGLMPIFRCAASSFSANCFETCATVAVRVTVCSPLTRETVVGNPTLVALAGTMTVVGTEIEVATEGSATVLDNVTLNPPLGAAELNDTVQVSVPTPVIDELLQESALSAGSLVASVDVVAAIAFPVIRAPQPHSARERIIIAKNATDPLPDLASLSFFVNSRGAGFGRPHERNRSGRGSCLRGKDLEKSNIGSHLSKSSRPWNLEQHRQCHGTENANLNELLPRESAEVRTTSVTSVTLGICKGVL